MQYKEAVDFIHAARMTGQKNGLANMQALLDLLGHPEHSFSAIHVAGTNGKGSVCAFMQAALRVCGYRTGLYTSPYLERYNERMRVDGVPISDDALVSHMERIAKAVGALRAAGVDPTVFEMGTALAFCHFAAEQVDVAIVEVGLGGRLDPTNVLMPAVTAIASIGLDHQQILGDTIEQIAAEKAGIAKPGVPMVITAQMEDGARRVIQAHCEMVGAPLCVATAYDGALGLPGAHQAHNAGLAKAALQKALPVSDVAIAEGFCRARWPGRLEWLLGGRLLLDGAHNHQGAQALAEYLRALPKANTVLLCGIMRDKDWGKVVKTLAGVSDHVVAVVPEVGERALPAEQLAEAFAAEGVCAEASSTVAGGLEKALSVAGPGGRVVAAGSLYVVGAVRALVKAGVCTLLAEE